MKSGFMTTSILATAVAGAMLTTLSASAQCVIDPNPTVVQDDACAGQAVDANGGCNLVPAVFQNAGTLSTGAPIITINGTVGTDAAATTRDLDWYSFTMATPGFVTVSTTSAKASTGLPASNLIVWVLSSTDCASYTVVSGGLLSAGVCPLVTAEVGLNAGTYAIIIGTDFNVADVCDIQYTATVLARYSAFAVCGDPAAGECGLSHPATTGCSDIICCDIVCSVNPLCCDLAWDAGCAGQAQQPPSLGGCGVFVYNCAIGVPANAPSNNCASNATVVALDATTPFNNANATTDGPNNGECDAEIFSDVWVIGQAPAAGNMSCFVNSASQDLVISVYNNGTTSTVVGSQLPTNFAGCVDVNGIGGEAAVLPNTIAGNWYLWRVGIWGNPGTADAGVPGPGDITLGFERVVYESGDSVPVCTPTGTATLLGLSSGAIAAGAPQRWLAAPFTVTDPDGAGAQDSWKLTLMQPEGFSPAGNVNEKMNFIIWNRDANNAKPLYATSQVASGQVAFPVISATYEADVATDITLVAGTYYATFFASAVGNPCTAAQTPLFTSNFAWFIGAPSGEFLTDATGIFAWRSANQPGSGPAVEVVNPVGGGVCVNTGAAGFVRYSSLNGAYANCTAGGSLGPVYTPALLILGNPVEAINTCPTDLDGNGVTDAADLAILLNAWGTGGVDLNGDGLTDAADLATLLNSWGACP